MSVGYVVVEYRLGGTPELNYVSIHDDIEDALAEAVAKREHTRRLGRREWFEVCELVEVES